MTFVIPVVWKLRSHAVDPNISPYLSTLLLSTLRRAFPKLAPRFQVRVQPQPAAPAREESQNLMLSGQGQPYFDTHTTTDTDDERVPSLRVPHQPLRDAAPTDPGSGEPSSERSRVGAAMSTETGETPPSTPTAPLHDTQTHLRAVHALLDSLPPEYRSDVKQQQQRRQQRPPPVSSGPVLKPRYPRGHFPTATVAHPLPSEEPLAERLEPDCEGAMYGKRATLHYSISGSRDVGESSACGRDDTGVGGGGEEPSSLPEIRRLLSSLDRVDRRLLNLASPGGDTCGEVRSSGKDARTAGGDGIYNYEASRNVPMLRDPLAEGERSSCSGGETGLVDDSRPRFADGADEQAATKIQGAWRTASMRRRRKAASLAQQEALRAASRRERARTESARTIQVAYRRAQARHRARAELEERRRWTDRQRRREAAYLTLARAWRAFECRRRGKRELAEARARVAAAAAAAAEHARKVDQAARAAIVIQKLLRGGLSRQAARRLRGARRHSGSGGNSDSRDAWSVGTRLSSSGSTATESSSNTNGNGENGELTGRVPDESVLLRATTGAHAARPMLSKPSSMASTTHCVVATPSAARTSPKNTTAPAAPRPLPPPPPSAPAPSTFYNQLSQDPRRRYPIPEAHVASAPSSALAKSLSSTEVAIAESRGVAVRSQRFGPPPADSAGRRVVGVMRPPRFADLETARIARIMKGNLQHWAGVRSSGGECSYSSSDDFDL